MNLWCRCGWGGRGGPVVVLPLLQWAAAGVCLTFPLLVGWPDVDVCWRNLSAWGLACFHSCFIHLILYGFITFLYSCACTTFFYILFSFFPGHTRVTASCCHLWGSNSPHRHHLRCSCWLVGGSHVSAPHSPAKSECAEPNGVCVCCLAGPHHLLPRSLHWMGWMGTCGGRGEVVMQWWREKKERKQKNFDDYIIACS